MYSAPVASLSCHAKYTASNGKKDEGSDAGSVDVDPGLRYRVGVDFGNDEDGERTMCVALPRVEAGSEPFVYEIADFDFIASWRIDRTSMGV